MRTGTDCRGRLWEEISLGKAKDLTNKKFFSLTPLFRVKIWKIKILQMLIGFVNANVALFDDTFLIRRGNSDDHR